VVELRMVKPTVAPPGKRPSASSGQGLIEFVLVGPLLLVILFAIADLGMMYLTAQTVQHATREGARFAVKLESLEANDPRVIEYVETNIPDVSLYASFFNSTSTEFTGCNSSSEVTVTVSGEYTFLVLNMIGLQTFPLDFSTTMRYEMCE
jgi:Flp pilus assembly protein TadG